MPNTTRREVLWVPIVHSQADLGSLSESIRQVHRRAFGAEQWERRVVQVEEFWLATRRRIEDQKLDPTQLRLYQDGLPCCGYEAQIVRDLARAGSLNHRILVELMEKGAEITGTESAELLLEEYQLAQQILASAGSGTTAASASQRQVSQTLLDRRDRFIAERIDKTLEPGKKGLIFLGMLHSIDRFMPADICLTRLSPDLQSASSTETRLQ